MSIPRVAAVCIACCVLAAVSARAGALAGGRAQEDRYYRVDFMYEVNAQGITMGQVPYSGWIRLNGDGTYKLQLHIDDEGRYQAFKAGGSNPYDTIVFTSRDNFQFYGYPQGEMLLLWLYTTESGTKVWVSAAPAAAPPTQSDVKSDIQTGLDGIAGGEAVPEIRNGWFTKVAMYGNTSVLSYAFYDPATGEISHDEKGVVFRPDGTYYIRAEFGAVLFEESGRYQVSGNSVLIVFSDGSSMTLTLEEGGKKLHRYDNGMLMAEYFFLGVAK